MLHFGLLRRSTARVAGATPPAQVEAALGSLSGLDSYGANAIDAAQTLLGPGGASAWLVPGSTGACLVNSEGPQGDSIGCNTLNAVESGELWTLDTVPYGSGGRMTQVLMGIVPDGNQSVTVTWTGGSTTVVPVSNNVYIVPIGSHSGWKGVKLKSASGSNVVLPGMTSLP